MLISIEFKVIDHRFRVLPFDFQQQLSEQLKTSFCQKLKNLDLVTKRANNSHKDCLTILFCELYEHTFLEQGIELLHDTITVLIEIEEDKRKKYLPGLDHILFGKAFRIGNDSHQTYLVASNTRISRKEHVL